MKYGLSDTQLDEIVALIGSYPEIEEAILFGSRAIGSYKEASDVDIALKGETVTAALAAKLKFDFEEDTYLPFFFDFVAYPTITSESLREHIEQKGVSIYRVGWRTFTVEQIKADSPNALATGPFGSSISSKFFTNKGLPVIRGGNLSADISTRLYETGFVFISESKANEFKRSEVRKGDLIFTCWGTINQVGLIDGKCSYPVYILSNKQMKLTPHPEKADSFFLYYYFSSPKIQEQILGNNIGSSVPGFNLGQLKTMELNLPPLSEQRAISSVLSILDDKIDLLHRQNKTLETMAETLFRQWFVEEADDGDTGQISDLVDFNLNRRLPKGSVAPYLEMANVNTTVFHPENWHMRAFTSGMKFKNGDTLLARITPCLENGKSAFVTFLDDNQIGWGSTEFIVMRSKEKLHPFFTYALVRNRGFRDYAEGCLEGSSGRQRVDVGHLSKFEINIPDGNVITLFNNAMDSIASKLHSNFIQIRTLSNIRDTLLPKLMSGEVRVLI